MFRICGTGSAIADELYSRVDFEGPEFSKYRSRSQGDGGLVPGKLVLTEDFEAFSGVTVDHALGEISGGREPDSLNLGGPGIVALVNAAQLLFGCEAQVSFHGVFGDDAAGVRIVEILGRTPVVLDKYQRRKGNSPTTYVMSDPSYHGGAGERTFINTIGCAWEFRPEDLAPEFFEGDIVLFGGTALVPRIHEALTPLTARAKRAGCLSVVTTVYDFLNEKRSPGKPWPLGRDGGCYADVDLLVTDREEALRLSGMNSIESAVERLSALGISALIVTDGAKGVHIFSRRALFDAESRKLPLSHAIEDARRDGPVSGDTTGCGDNFAGGVLSSLARQRMDGRERLSLAEAASWGIASGDFACFYLGGTYHEKTGGEKLEKVSSIHELYLNEYGKLL